MNLAYFISTDVLNFSSWQLFADPQIFILTQKCVSYCVRSHMLSKTSKKREKAEMSNFVVNSIQLGSICEKFTGYSR